MRILCKTLMVLAFVSSAETAFAQSASRSATESSWVGAYAGLAATYSQVSNTSADLKPSGFSGVSLFGANLVRYSNLVFGVEGASALFGSVKDGAASAGAAWSISGRAGYALGDIMPFVSVGVGRAEGKYSGGGRSSAYFTSTVIGGGIESRITSSINWRVEGLWSPSLNPHNLGGSDVKPNAAIFRTGLTYKFY